MGQRWGVACRAKGDAEAPALGLDALAPLTRTPLYRWGLQGAVVLVILGAVDAGWSGDWHRLGVLTTDQEAAIRGLLALLGFFHIGAGLEPLVLWQMVETVWHTASTLRTAMTPSWLSQPSFVLPARNIVGGQLQALWFK